MFIKHLAQALAQSISSVAHVILILPPPTAPFMDSSATLW